jgi:hypothetical protein
VRVHVCVHACAGVRACACALADVVVAAVAVVEVVGKQAAKKVRVWLFSHFQMNDFGSP